MLATGYHPLSDRSNAPRSSTSRLTCSEYPPRSPPLGSSSHSSFASFLCNPIRVDGHRLNCHDSLRSFFDTEMPAESMDAVLSQDAFSHASTEHHRAIEEAARVLKPGGVMAFTDLMQTGNADPAKLAEVHMNRPFIKHSIFFCTRST